MLIAKRFLFVCTMTLVLFCAACPAWANASDRVTDFVRGGDLEKTVSGSVIEDFSHPICGVDIYKARFGNVRCQVRFIESDMWWKIGLVVQFGEEVSDELMIPVFRGFYDSMDLYEAPIFKIREIRYNGTYSMTIFLNCRGITVDLRDGAYKIDHAYPTQPQHYIGQTDDGRYKIYSENLNAEYLPVPLWDRIEVFVRNTETGEDRFLGTSSYWENINISGDMLALAGPWRFFDIPSAQELDIGLQRRDNNDMAKDEKQQSLAVLYDPEREQYIHLFAFCEANGWIENRILYPEQDLKIRVDFYNQDGQFLSRDILDAYPEYVNYIVQTTIPPRKADNLMNRSSQATIPSPVLYNGKLVIQSRELSNNNKSYIFAYDLDTGEQIRYVGETFDAHDNILVTSQELLDLESNKYMWFVSKYVDGIPTQIMWFTKDSLEDAIIDKKPGLTGSIRYDYIRDEVEFLGLDYSVSYPEPYVAFSYPFPKAQS